jgi:hypothetical protein
MLFVARLLVRDEAGNEPVCCADGIGIGFIVYNL